MTAALTTIFGDKLGLGPNGELITSGGFESGGIASRSGSKVVFFDDFLGDVIADEWNAVEGTDSATSASALLDGGIGGVLRLTTGDAGTGYAADAEQMTQFLQWQASNGGLVFETRAKLSAITTCQVFLGFTDVATLEAPIESAGSADTITTNASDAVGFMFDTRMTNDTWWLVGVAADVDATKQNTGLAPVADTWAKFRIEVKAAGAADFYYNGLRVGTTLAGAVTAGTDLTPTLAVSKTSVAASMTMDIDYVYVAMNR